MILLSIDFETTGVDTENDRVIELGAILYSTGQRKCLESLGNLVLSSVPITPRITEITSIHPAAVERFGYDSESSLSGLLTMAEQADAYIGYNARRFDRKVWLQWASLEKLEVPNKPWIDLFADLPWRVPTGKLSHVAADHGILNLFPHSAMSDAQTVLALAEKYDIDLLLQRAQSPVVVLKAHIDRQNNDVVKQAPFKFRWNPTNKMWWRQAKQQDAEEIIQSASFKITVEKGWSPEDLEN